MKNCTICSSATHALCAHPKGSVIFLPGGGLPKMGGQVLFLRSKGGIKRFFQIKKGDHLYFLKGTKYFVKHFKFQGKGMSDPTRGRNSNETFQINVETFSYILVLKLISHNLRRNAEGTQITLVYKVQFLCGSPSFLDGYKNMTDTTDIL